ncbi:MAG: hypothetical protein NTV34_13340 [Proteobacteria bacterium]|nr:hypothetical protein [Pseudomonadota bacterium]
MNTTLRLVIAVSSIVVILDGCRTVPPPQTSAVRDIADPGTMGSPNRYFRLVNDRVRMADCAADQVPTPQCSLHPIEAPYEFFAKRVRENLRKATAAARAKAEASEAPLHSAQAAGAKKEADAAAAKLAEAKAKTQEITTRIEGVLVLDKAARVEDQDIQNSIATITTKIASASGEDLARLRRLLQANQDDLAKVQARRRELQARINVIYVERDNHVSLVENPAQNIFDKKAKSYRDAYAAEITPTAELLALLAEVKASQKRQEVLEELLKLLIERDVPNRTDLLDPGAQFVMKQTFVEGINSTNGEWLRMCGERKLVNVTYFKKILTWGDNSCWEHCLGGWTYGDHMENLQNTNYGTSKSKKFLICQDRISSCTYYDGSDRTCECTTRDFEKIAYSCPNDKS